MTVAAPMVLKRARAAYEGRLMVMKGPGGGGTLPDPGLLGASEMLDLLPDDPDAGTTRVARCRLRRASDRPRLLQDDQHLCPTGLARAASGRRAPPTPKLRGVPEPAATRRAVGDGRSQRDRRRRTARAGARRACAATRCPRMDASSTRSCGRSHRPRGDAPAGERLEADALARRWGWERMWQTTLAVADAVLAARVPHREHCAGGCATSPRFASSPWWRTTCSRLVAPTFAAAAPGARRAGPPCTA